MDSLKNKFRRLSFTGHAPRSRAVGPSQFGELTPPVELHQPAKEQIGATGPIQQDFSRKSFIETALKQGCIDSKSITSTVNVKSQRVGFPEKTLRLIDTPGFDSLALGNLETFKKLSDYLLHR
ncbi:hypothetical protein FRC10_007914 [Ceratobasidium sp. 414]|nr:hypothetical protein FRC10_007914 [Ceratobasidium sp. 414]